MSKEKKETKSKKSVHSLKVTKEIKIQAAMAKVRGGNFRQVIRALGEAEQAFRLNGCLILDKSARSSGD